MKHTAAVCAAMCCLVLARAVEEWGFLITYLITELPRKRYI